MSLPLMSTRARWRADNPEKVAIHNARSSAARRKKMASNPTYRAAYLAKHAVRCARYRAAHPEKCREADCRRALTYYYANLEKVREAMRLRAAARRVAHPEKCLEYKRLNARRCTAAATKGYIRARAREIFQNLGLPIPREFPPEFLVWIKQTLQTKRKLRKAELK